MIGTTEIVLLAAAALLLFGGKKLPQFMRNMGKGVKEFKEGVQGAPEQFQAGMNNEIEQEAKTDSSPSCQEETPEKSSADEQ